jgi:hypothetical protein
MKKLYSLAEAKKILQKNSLSKRGSKKAPRVFRKAKSKTVIGGHHIKKVEYLTANPVHATRWIIQAMKNFQSPFSALYIAPGERLVHSHLEARRFSTEREAKSFANKLIKSGNLHNSIYALKPTEIRL